MLPALAQNFTIIRHTASFQASVFLQRKALDTDNLFMYYLFLMTRQIVGLHVAYTMLYTYRKMQYYNIVWDMASDMQYRYQACPIKYKW